MNLTAKQYEIVKLIWQYRKSNGISPTLAELAQELTVSKITVHEHIALLEKKKALTKEKYQSRSLRLTKKMERELERVQREQQRSASIDEPDATPTTLPLLGKIAAGIPIDVVETEDQLDLKELVRFDRASYVLKVEGDSMKNAGIRDGDYVLVEHRQIAQNGEIVVAIVNDDEVCTLKRFFREGNKVRLQPENDDIEPIVTDKVEIRGVVVSSLRKY